MPVEAAVAAVHNGDHSQQGRVVAGIDRARRAWWNAKPRFQFFPIIGLRQRGRRLSLTATDLDLSLRTSCSAKVKKEGVVHDSGAEAA